MKRRALIVSVMFVFAFAVCCLIGCQPDHVHSFAGEWHSDESGHWLECECGEKGELFSHDYDGDVCTECGYDGDFIDNLIFTAVNDNEFGLTGIVDKSVTKIVIPNKYQGKPVTSIGDDAFSNCDSVESIIIPKYLTKIEGDVFEKLYELNEVQYEGDISSWCNIEFEDECSNPLCTGAKLYIQGKPLEGELIIPEEVTEIGDYAFYYYIYITSVTINGNITRIGQYAFGCCFNIWEVRYEGDLASWCNIEFEDECSNPLWSGVKLFIQGKSLEGELIIPDEITEIKNYTFFGCFNLTNVTIGDNVTSIGESAFEGCIYLTNLTMGKNVSSIAEGAFYYCINLTSATIGENLTSIGDYAFWSCFDLTGIMMGDSVTNIGDYAFAYCFNLARITLGEGVTSIGDRAFESCYKLIEVCNKSDLDIQAGKETFGGVGAYAKNVYKPEEGESKLIDYGDYTFYEDSENALPGYEEYAFYVDSENKVYYLISYNGKDKNLTLPDNYEGKAYEIYQYAFYRNENIESVTIGDNVTSIGDSAFFCCDSLLSITIGANVMSIYRNAFVGCVKLIEVCNKSDLDIQADAWSFGYVGCYAKNVYKPGEGESKLREYEDYTFYEDDENNKYYLVNYNGNEADITLPDNYEGKAYEINEYAFYENNNLHSITFGTGVIGIGESAFDYCFNLDEVRYEGDISSWCNIEFEDYCFNIYKYIYVNIVKIYIQGKRIEENLIIPDEVKEIKTYAFCNCVSITSVTIGSNVESIGYCAFDKCYNLESVYYHGTKENWESIEISVYNDALTEATVYYFSLDDPYANGTAESGEHYWHYSKDGTIAVWQEH